MLVPYGNSGGGNKMPMCGGQTQRTHPHVSACPLSVTCGDTHSRHCITQLKAKGPL
ncbi:hypothetical protein T484DRAFT_1987937 [Baffinella frigidus]|nr:hypothetical protein T484DRAFT_1987937 [Cryptophyta sp. CCMP2293]